VPCPRDEVNRPSVGSVSDAYDNALAETINGPYKTEVIRRRSSWKTMEELEMETLKWLDWLNKNSLVSGKPRAVQNPQCCISNLNFCKWTLKYHIDCTNHICNLICKVSGET
jgi:hypothetical protein